MGNEIMVPTLGCVSFPISDLLLGVVVIGVRVFARHFTTPTAIASQAIFRLCGLEGGLSLTAATPRVSRLGSGWSGGARGRAPFKREGDFDIWEEAVRVMFRSSWTFGSAACCAEWLRLSWPILPTLVLGNEAAPPRSLSARGTSMAWRLTSQVDRLEFAARRS
jgi:hypothetical protein